MPAVAVMAVASIAMQAGSMYMTDKANKQSASDAVATAAYNARVDLADAKQEELDSIQNTHEARNEARIFLSRQSTAYAASGVLLTGSPLSVRATTAGRLEQRILQDRTNVQRDIEKREASARMGVIYGNVQAQGIMRRNTAAMFSGGASILSTMSGASQSGAFSGSKGSFDSAASMRAAGAPSAVATRYGT